MIDVKFAPKDEAATIHLEFDGKHRQKLLPDEARELCVAIIDALDMDVAFRKAQLIRSDPTLDPCDDNDHDRIEDGWDKLRGAKGQETTERNRT